jgi:predicted GNAT family acetyltransferase
MLVQAIMSAADGSFSSLRVRTQNPAAARLYVRLGFQPVPGLADYTHVFEMRAV